MDREPVLAAATVTAIVQGLIAVAIVTGWVTLPLERGSLLYVLVVVGLALPWPFLNAWYVRQRTTALVDPRDEDGCPLVRADGGPTLAQIRWELGPRGSPHP